MLANDQVFNQIFGSLVGDSYKIVKQKPSSSTSSITDANFQDVFKKMYNECSIDLKMCIIQTEEEKSFIPQAIAAKRAVKSISRRLYNFC